MRLAPTPACLPLSFPEKREEDKRTEVRTFWPCSGRFSGELNFDAGDPRGLCEVQDEEAAKHAWGSIGEETAAATGGIARAEEDDGLCEPYVEGILVGDRLHGCGHEWLVCVCGGREREKDEDGPSQRPAKVRYRSIQARASFSSILTELVAGSACFANTDACTSDGV